MDSEKPTTQHRSDDFVYVVEFDDPYDYCIYGIYRTEEQARRRRDEMDEKGHVEKARHEWTPYVVTKIPLDTPMNSWWERQQP